MFLFTVGKNNYFRYTENKLLVKICKEFKPPT